MKIQVEYFGPARDWVGAESEAIELKGAASLGDLIEHLSTARPDCAEHFKIVRFAVNEEFAANDRALVEGDRVAVIPPVSGGCGDDWVEIVKEPIDAVAIRQHVSGDPAVGGVATFDGVTRFERHPEHGDLVRLDYEAHSDMAVKEMRKLAAAARKRWGVKRLALVHRVGAVPIGESSIIIAVACGHRVEAFEACRYLIDTLKKDVPIWKKEIWSGEVSTWVDPTQSGQ